MSAKLARGILPALCTPFDDSGQHLAPDRVPALIRALLDAGSNGLFVCGGTGEGRSMSVQERKQMAAAVADAVAGAVPIILQVGATSTSNAVELARHAATIKVDAVASVAPVDQPNDLQAAIEHYAAIGAATDLPFYVYWLAATADQAITAPQFLEAMQAVPNFAGIKFTDPRFYFFQQLVALSAGQVNAITGPDEMCLPGMVMGSDAAIGTTYNIMPRLFLQMRRDFEEGHIRQAMESQTRANQVISILIRLGMMGGVKAMLGWRGTPVGPPRPPLEPISAADEAQLRREFDDLEFEVA